MISESLQTMTFLVIPENGGKVEKLHGLELASKRPRSWMDWAIRSQEGSSITLDGFLIVRLKD